MSETQEPDVSVDETFDTNPAIGVVATGDNTDEIARILVRATTQDFPVLVLCPSSDSFQLPEADELDDVHVIKYGDRSLGGGGSIDSDSARDRLVAASRTLSVPGLLFVSDPSQPINFDRSTAQLDDPGYVFDAVPAEQEPTPETMVAVPAYNEEHTIASVVRDTSPKVDEVIVVDDGSGDRTAEVAREAGATVIEHEQNRGYGGALKTAFQEANRRDVSHLVIIDGDGQHDPTDIERMIDRQKETGSEVVVGCRFGDRSETSMPLYRRAGLEVVNVLTNLSLGVVRSSSRVRDTQNGFRAYDETAIASLANDSTIGNHMGASTDILHHAHSNNYDIAEVQTTVDYSTESDSSHNPIQHGITLVSNLLTTVERERPILILGVPGLVVLCVGIGVSYWTLANYLGSGTFPVGLGVTSVFFTLLGVFTVFASIILHALKVQLDAIDTGQ